MLSRSTKEADMKIRKSIFQYIKSRLPLMLLILCAVSGVVVNAVYAKYVKDIDRPVDVAIVGEGNIKIAVSKNDDEYSIHHTSESKIPAYIRFAVVTNWKQKEGDALWYTGPQNVTVTSSNALTSSNAQPLSDGYYYCVVDGKAEIAIDKVVSGITVTTKEVAPDGYELEVKILAEAIQCMPASVVRTAWGVTFNGGVWEKVTP
jgi:hypothetical protein